MRRGSVLLVRSCSTTAPGENETTAPRRLQQRRGAGLAAQRRSSKHGRVLAEDRPRRAQQTIRPNGGVTAFAQTRAPGPRPAACLLRTRNRRQIRPATLFPNERIAEAPARPLLLVGGQAPAYASARSRPSLAAPDRPARTHRRPCLWREASLGSFRGRALLSSLHRGYRAMAGGPHRGYGAWWMSPHEQSWSIQPAAAPRCTIRTSLADARRAAPLTERLGAERVRPTV